MEKNFLKKIFIDYHPKTFLKCFIYKGLLLVIESAQDFLIKLLVGHVTMYASSGNKHFFTKSCRCQSYQNYEQSRQKLGTILGNKVS